MPTTSGLIRPSSVGPQQEKSLNNTSLPYIGICVLSSAAPTVNIFFALPVVEMISYPSFFAREMDEESRVFLSK